MNPLKQTPFLAALALLVLAAGCAEQRAAPLPVEVLARAPREAILQAFQADVLQRKAVVDMDTVAVLQEQPVRGDVVFALLSFNETSDNGRVFDCLYHYGVKRTGGGWSANDYGGGCRPPGMPVDGSPIDVGSAGGWSRDPQALTYAAVYGRVFDERVSAVEVTWDDGAVQRVAAANRTFLAVRLAERSLTKVEALDQEGEVIFTFQP